MNITRVTETNTFNNPHGVQAKRILDAPQATVIHMALNPGEHLTPHATPVDVFFYILQGEPEIEIGDERIRVSVDSLVESPANIPHL